MIGRLKDLTIDLNGEQNITVAVRGDFRPGYRRLKDLDIDIEIKQHREHRSRDANAYAWTLIGKIAEAIKPPLPKDDVYLMMLKRYGQSEIVSVVSTVDVSGYFKYYEECGAGMVNGREFTHYKVFKGSSEYDTKEMSLLIDGIVADAKELGIATDTPDQIVRYKEAWGK